jgi:hypothetical protein
MPKIEFIYLSLVLLILSGCATFDYKGQAQLRRSSYVNSHPNLKKEAKDSILAGKFRLGMTREEVRASVGDPRSMDSSSSFLGTSEMWTYGNCMYGCTMLTFYNGKLSDVYQNKSGY